MKRFIYSGRLTVLSIEGVDFTLQPGGEIDLPEGAAQVQKRVAAGTLRALPAVKTTRARAAVAPAPPPPPESDGAVAAPSPEV